MKIFSVALSLLFLMSCNYGYINRQNIETKNKSIAMMSEGERKGNLIIDAAILSHGGELYNKAKYAFTFRDKRYIFKNDGTSYRYTVKYEKDGNEIYDVLDNNGIKREVNGSQIELTPKQVNGYSSGLNSVIYFATLPHKLDDAAVHKSYVGETSIKNIQYDVVEVTFDAEGGGADHDDTYYYWINKKSSLIDYLAYNYQVGKGGVRFRSAYNPRRVEGIIFQDYVNYKAEVGTPLSELPSLWAAGELVELSRIKTEDVTKLK